MSRFILIDNKSGFIFGDTADYAAGESDLSPAGAARLLDLSIGEHNRTYTELPETPDTAQLGYEVYSLDRPGVIDVVSEGQDPTFVAEAIRAGRYAGFVLIEATEPLST
ncbi:hypothetical protein FXN63_14160 [Pigmentiphaga aceris]|uniref:Uncharacterized protein n=1 Tax=Pigmentiphaga aceris TaxID=1940612 RepID=A0A5C0B263_9BURK|nr:hypothetical protein [Pigmentiphaga aceris]QEI06851.1 hypothetical protein FXN63_14160 [Pigmentiphaga aceris]